MSGTDLENILGGQFQALPLEQIQPEKSEEELQVEHRRNKYTDTFSQPLLDAYVANAPTYDRNKNSRYNPFDLPRLEALVVAGRYSHLIRRPVNNFKDSLDVAHALCECWFHEDNLSLGEIQDEKHELIRQRLDHKERLEVLQSAWREAVRERDEAWEQLNKKVEHARLAYREAKSIKI